MFSNYRKKIAKFVKGLPIDEKRIVQEAAISADKTSIAEEINRLKTHSQRLKRLLQDQKRRHPWAGKPISSPRKCSAKPIPSPPRPAAWTSTSRSC